MRLYVTSTFLVKSIFEGVLHFSELVHSLSFYCLHYLMLYWIGEHVNYWTCIILNKILTKCDSKNHFWWPSIDSSNYWFYISKLSQFIVIKVFACEHWQVKTKSFALWKFSWILTQVKNNADLYKLQLYVQRKAHKRHLIL